MSASVEFLQAASGSNPAADAKSCDPARKHRSLWSFLTRTFVLGQLLVAEHFFGTAARAHEANDALGTGDGTSLSAAEAGGGASVLGAAATGDEAGAPGAANAAQAKTLPGTLPQGYQQDLPGSGDTAADVAAATGAGAQAAGGSPEDATVADAGPGDGGTDGVGHITDPVVEPVIDLVGNVGDTVNDVLDTVGDTVGNLLDGLGETVGSLAPAVFAPVHELAKGLPIFGDPLAAITGQAEAVVSNTLGDVATVFPALGNVVGSGVIPDLKGAVSIATNPDRLFDNGKYSDFNITLQIAEPAGSALTTIGSATDTLFDSVADTLDLPTGPSVTVASSVLGDPLKGGLGDLFS